MTAIPTLSSSPSQDQGSAGDPTGVPANLHSRVEQSAAPAGLSVVELCVQWIRQGVQQAEQQRALAESSGRCSLPTDTWTVGPVPLPVQH
jgi:hypothetical protein